MVYYNKLEKIRRAINSIEEQYQFAQASLKDEEIRARQIEIDELYREIQLYMPIRIKSLYFNEK
jgi:hypothetical protein